MRSIRVRTVASLARIEAVQLARSVVVLSGLLASGFMVWSFTSRSQPLWWNGDWAIGYGQTVLSLAALIATQLATGRARREDLAELYESFPTSAAPRTLGHLIGVVGAVPASLVLIGVAAGVFEWWGVVGTPNAAVLAGGVLLVLAGGSIGVAIGSWRPHPLAGMLGAFVWFIPFSQSNRFDSAVVWLFPWVKPWQLGDLPGRLAGYPPASAHAVELAAIGVLAGGVALTITAVARRHRVALLVVAIAALATIVVACVVQLRPISTHDLDRLVAEVSNTESTQRCTTTDAGGHSVSYCLFPEFASQLASLRRPVDRVLSLVPDLANRALTISQTSGLTLDDPSLTRGHSSEQRAAWIAQLQSAPANRLSTSAIYVNLGSWPSSGGQSVPRFALALGAAAWAVGLPTNSGQRTDLLSAQCVPVNQAREAIAIWLAGQATHLPSARFPSSSGDYSVAPVDGTAVVIWLYPGQDGPYFASPGPQATAAGYLLARAMTKLPTDRVTTVLHATWDTWTNPQTTDDQLAATLGIKMPEVNVSGPGGSATTALLPPGPATPQPRCT